MRVIKTVRLNGKDCEIDSDEIRTLCTRIEPKSIDKYWVTINGRSFPPKQLVSELLHVSLVSFTTMDANRVLSAVGFKIYSDSEKPAPIKTESEILLEEYLRIHGWTDFEFEPTIPNATKKPDYLLQADGVEVLLEVKEFCATPEDFLHTGGSFDPYGRIREKIGAGRKKFKDMDKYCCCLVLHNQGKPLVDLRSEFVLGAMLGNLGISIPVDTRTGTGDVMQAKQVMLGGGKMYKYQGQVPIAPENRTISAILVVERYRIGEKRFQLFVQDKEQELGRELDVEEFLGLADRSAGTERDLSLNRIRIRVHENPYARIPLPRHIFTGFFDERFGEVEETGRWARVYVGKGVEEFETRSPIARFLSKNQN